MRKGGRGDVDLYVAGRSEHSDVVHAKLEASHGDTGSMQHEAKADTEETVEAWWR